MSGLIDIWNGTYPLVFSWDFILMGIILLALILGILFFIRVKMAGILIVFAGFIYLLSMFESLFKPVFWLIIIGAVISLIFSVKEKTR